MKLRGILWLGLVIIVLALVGVFLYPASAGSELPDGVEVFQVGDHTCVLVERVYYGQDAMSIDLECFCPCEEECDVQTDRPDPIPTTVPTDEPDPTPTNPPPDTPEPPDKEKCNRGIGNDAEGCDPGNSSGQGQGGGRDAGEDRDEHKKDG